MKYSLKKIKSRIQERGVRDLVNSFVYQFEEGKLIKVHYPPRHVTINIDSRCNLRCQYCHCHGTNSRLSTRGWHVNFEQVKKQIDILRDNHVGHIHICGVGEPFLNKDIFKIFDYLNKIGDRPSILTNGTSVISNKLEKIIDANLSYFKTDLDTLDRNTYKEICGKDELGYVLSNIENLANLRSQKKSDMQMKVNTILTKQTLPHLKAICDKMIELGVDLWRLTSLMLGDEEKDYLSKENALIGKESEVYHVIHDLREHAKKYNLKINISEQFDPDCDNDNLFCSSFWKRVMLNVPTPGIPEDKWYGNVVVGCFLSFDVNNNLGNIFDTDFNKIWNGNKMAELRKKIQRDEISYCNDVCLKHRFPK